MLKCYIFSPLSFFDHWEEVCGSDSDAIGQPPVLLSLSPWDIIIFLLYDFHPVHVNLACGVICPPPL